MVPHFGSKTINVRLTVSPDTKSKSGESERKNAKKTRLKSRRLFKHGDDADGIGNGCLELSHEIEKKPATKQLVDDTQPHQTATSNRRLNEYEKSNGIIDENTHGISKDTLVGQIIPCCNNENEKSQRQVKTNETTENIYEKTPVAIILNESEISPGKFVCDKVMLSNNNNTCCQDCRPSASPNCIDGIPNSRPCVRRLAHKSRSRKTKSHEYYPATRTRSLSVGNENSYRNSNGDASSGASGKDRNDECLNNLRRNDLIDIIRESMEKSRLCFQSNG